MEINHLKSDEQGGSMVFVPLIKIMLPVLIGYIVKKSGYFPERKAEDIRHLVIRITVPALVFMNLYKAEINEIEQFVPVSFSLILFSAILWLFAVGLTGIPAFKKKRIENVFIILFSNVGFIGWAVLNYTLGEEGLRRGIFFTSFWWINLFLFGALTQKLLLKSENSMGKKWIEEMLPSLTALLAGLVLNLLQIQVPGFLTGFLEDFGAMTVPLLLLTIGMSISFRKSGKHMREVLPIIFIRHILIFGAMLITLAIIPGFDELSRTSLLIETIMPVAASVVILGGVFKRDTDYLSSAVTISTLLSFITIPLIIVFNPFG